MDRNKKYDKKWNQTIGYNIFCFFLSKQKEAKKRKMFCGNDAKNTRFPTIRKSIYQQCFYRFSIPLSIEMPSAMKSTYI